MPTIEKIKKRNGQIVDFSVEKITKAIENAFIDEFQDPRTTEAHSITDQVVRKLEEGESVPSVELIQDLVEQALMERGFYIVAKNYIIYRYQHEKVREEKKEEMLQKIDKNVLMITKSDGSCVAFSTNKIKKTLGFAAIGYEADIDQDAIVAQVKNEVYEGMTTHEVSQILIMVVRSFIERDSVYTKVAAQLLLFTIYEEVLGEVDYTKLEELHAEAFMKNIKQEVENGKLDSRMLEFNLEKLGKAMKLSFDKEFKYLGLQTLYDRYFLRRDKLVVETPQMFWMRIAMGTALKEVDKEKWALEFYNIMATMLYTPSTPTLFHAGTSKPQLSSCYLSTVGDSLDQIFKNYSDSAQLSKWSGGLGIDWTSVRATGSNIKGTGVESQGVIPFLKIANDVTAAINRSGRRRGAACVYLETWHFDILDFIELRKNTGDERRRTHDLNTANWIPDLFMKRVEEGGNWTLFSPSDVPELHEIYGREFEKKYEEYEAMAERGELKSDTKKIKAEELWRKMMAMLFETGHAWITFKDPSNIRSPQDHAGVVHSSNLCTEITLNTSRNETAVCNLGSLNLAKFVKNGVFDKGLAAEVVPTAMRMLDNVINLNFYPTKDAKRSNMKHRPVGLGVRGLQDALYQLGINFDSDAAVQFSDESTEVIAYYAILASSLLSKERGAYESFKGSKWDRGILPQDTLALLEAERGMTIDVPRNERMDWSVVRDSIKEHGMRNSNTMAIAPTATTANIVGCFPTVEPIYKNLYVKSNQAGDFIVTNDYLINDLKKLNLWNKKMLDQIKFHDGKLHTIASIPQEMKDRYKEVFEIEPMWLVKAAAYRGRWIDQSQSLNIYFNGTSGKVLTEVYFYAWKMGLKTTYYLRSEAATQVEKSTVNAAEYGSTHTRNEFSNTVGVPATVGEVTPPVPAPVVVSRESDGGVCESCEA